MEELINKAVEKLGPQYSDKLKSSTEEVVKKIYLEGVRPKDAMEINDETMEGIYQIGCELYSSGKFDDARKIFALLRFLDGTQFKYVFSQALCYHRSNDFVNAAACYAFSAMMNPEDPWPLMRVAECYLSLNLPDLALEILNDVIERSGENPEYEEIKERAQLMREKIKQELLEKEKEQKSSEK
jgi:type III secretion system low calcium response chaperone LcrH/SycD